MKFCSTCKQDKSLDNFTKDKSRKDGLNIKCTDCKKEYTRKSRSKYIKYQREYRKNNSSKVAKFNKRYQREKRQKDTLHRLKSNLRTRIWLVLKGNTNKNTEKLLGADIHTVKEHLESTFTEGMDWENYGEWHVDHKIPLASANSVEEVEDLCHYTNLQALWAEDNLRKSYKLV